MSSPWRQNLCFDIQQTQGPGWSFAPARPSCPNKYLYVGKKNDELVRQEENIFQNVALSIVKKKSDLFPEYFVVTLVFKPIWLKSMEKESPKKAVNT